MFTGIVEETAAVKTFSQTSTGCSLSVVSGLDHAATALGDSIAIDGVCLTVVKKQGAQLWFDLADETLRRTTLGEVSSGSRVNLERSLRVGERVHGHFVFGHVDGLAELVTRTNEQHSIKMVWRFPAGLRGLFAEKGSVSLSGISLTLGEVRDDTFAVYLIPHTLAVTTLSDRKPGDMVNLEVDMLARYVQAQLQNITPRAGLSRETLIRCGFDGGAE